MIRTDDHFRETLAGYIRKVSKDVYEWKISAPDDIASVSNANGLDVIDEWNYLLTVVLPPYVGAKFAAEIAWEFTYRAKTIAKNEKWSTQDISEYVTRKVKRQQDAHDPKIPWWPNQFASHIFLGLGPWPVSDDADDPQTADVAIGTSHKDRKRSFGTGPWPKGDGTD
jgi:hypothetical protein